MNFNFLESFLSILKIYFMQIQLNIYLCVWFVVHGSQWRAHKTTQGLHFLDIINFIQLFLYSILSLGLLNDYRTHGVIIGRWNVEEFETYIVK